MTRRKSASTRVGVYLPESVRRNDYWPADARREVARARRPARLQRTDDAFGTVTSEGTRRSPWTRCAKLGDDPFQGLVERRAMPEGMTAADMETAAARDAIARAGIDPQQIDLVLSYTMCPDFINVPTACVVHANLGLPERCLTLAVDAVCNSFIMQLTLAQSDDPAGRARYALLDAVVGHHAHADVGRALRHLVRRRRHRGRRRPGRATSAASWRVAPHRRHAAQGAGPRRPRQALVRHGRVIAYSEDRAPTSTWWRMIVEADRATGARRSDRGGGPDRRTTSTSTPATRAPAGCAT